MMFKRFAARITAAAICVSSPALAGNESHFTDSAPASNQPEISSANAAGGFSKSTGQNARLVDFHGKIVLLSFWAPWCAPCKHELKSLDRLQAILGGADFVVVPISVDGSESAIESTYSDFGISHLGIYREWSDDLPLQLGVQKVPTNIVMNRDGRVVHVSTGPTQWDSPQALEMIKSLIGKSYLQSPAREEGNMTAASLTRGRSPRAFFTPTSSSTVPDNPRESGVSGE